MNSTSSWVLLCLFFIAGFFSCESIFKCPECFTPPSPLLLKIVSANDSNDLVYNGFYHSDTISIYYLDKNIKKPVEVDVIIDSIKKTSLIVSNEIGWISAGGNKSFFLYLNATDTDTLFLDVREANDDCCTYFDWVSFEINDQVVENDYNYGWYTYFK